jgi:hypothetical protein
VTVSIDISSISLANVSIWTLYALVRDSTLPPNPNCLVFRSAIMQQYSGPIFDGDTHIYEQADAYSRYLPEKCRKTLEVRHIVEDGKYPLYVGPWKILPGEDAMRLIDTQRARRPRAHSCVIRKERSQRPKSARSCTRTGAPCSA